MISIKFYGKDFVIILILSITLQFNLTFIKYKQPSDSVIATMSMKDSITSGTKLLLKESQFIERLNEPLSTNLIKHFSNPGSLSTVGTKTHNLKIKKYESLQTNSTDSEPFYGEEGKFINLYKSDSIFRKKVDILIKQYEKRMKQKQQNYSLSQPKKMSFNNTWRTQKHSQETHFIDLYQKCRKWIIKANEKV